jgi:hypothetical protein
MEQEFGVRLPGQMLITLLFALIFAQAASPEPKAFPTDVGVYFQADSGDWTEVEPEIVNWKTGGVTKAIVSSGWVKPDINGHLKGGKSPNRAPKSSAILIVAMEGVAATEYELLRLHTHSKAREFRATTGGVFHRSGGSDRDEIDIQHKKVASRTYLFTLPEKLNDGEYGILPPGAVVSRTATSLGKIYSFRVAN